MTNETKLFLKLLEWRKGSNIATSVILKEAKLTRDQYSRIKNEFKIEASTKAKMQNFNKKWLPDYTIEHAVDDLPEEVVEDPKEKSSFINPDSIVRGKAIDDLIKNPVRISRRKAEKAQEEIFFERLTRLYDSCPDHLSIDVIIKRVV